MTILLVDDEYYLVQGVKAILEQNDFGIDQILTAYSAQQARELYESQDIDILLADVEMPKEDGLSLVRWVRESGYESVNILLTGHENFQYARTAIELEVLDYLVKPATADSLSAVLKRAVSRIRQREDEKQRSRQVHMNALWRSLYNGTLSADPDSIALFMNRYDLGDITLSPQYFYAYLTVDRSGELPPDPAYAGADATPLLPAVDDGKGGLSFPVLVKTLQQEMGADTWLATVDSRGYMVSFAVDAAAAESDSAAFRSKITSVMDQLNEQYPQTRLILYLFDTAPLAAAPYARELLQQYSSRIFSSSGSVIPVLETSGSNSFSVPDRQLADKLQIPRWADWIAQRRGQDILLQLRSYFQQRDQLYSSRSLSIVYYGLLHAVFSAFNDREEALTELSDNMAHSGDLTSILASPEQLLLWAARVVDETASLLTRTDDASSVTEQVKAFIRSHYMDPGLDRARIAEAVHMSPDYLSYLFHKEADTTLSAYLNAERISAAKKLLLTTDAGAQEIAEKVGFSGVPYFHKQFKKSTGLTPNAYRKQQEA